MTKKQTLSRSDAIVGLIGITGMAVAAIVGMTIAYNVFIQPIFGGPILNWYQGASILTVIFLLRLFLQ